MRIQSEEEVFKAFVRVKLFFNAAKTIPMIAGASLVVLGLFVGGMLKWVT